MKGREGKKFRKDERPHTICTVLPHQDTVKDSQTQTHTHKKGKQEGKEEDVA